MGARPVPTDWSRYGLEELLASVNHPLDTRNWEQVAAWRLMSQVCAHHASVLRKAADTLSEHWSPSENTSARLFLRRIEHLAEQMEVAGYRASANGSAVELVLTSHGAANDALLAIEADKKKPRWQPKTPYDGVPFDRQAREVMATFDAALADARSQLQEIPLAGDRDPGAPPSGEPGPVPPTGLSAGGYVLRGSGPTAPSLRSPWLPWSPSPIDGSGSGPTVDTPDGGPWDPVLDGDWLPTGKNPTGPSAPGIYGTGGYGFGEYGAGASDAAPSSAGSGTGRAPASTSGSTPASASGAPTAGAARNGQSMMPMVPPAGATPAGRAGSGSGGVRPGGVPGNSYAASRRRTRGADGWTVAKGVPPVIEPPPACDDHDPGPGVIGGCS
jgi:hypothetical protein